MGKRILVSPLAASGRAVDHRKNSQVQPSSVLRALVCLRPAELVSKHHLTFQSHFLCV